MKIIALYLANLLEYAAYQGFDKNSLIEKSEIEQIDFSNPLEMVNANLYLSIWEKIIKNATTDFSGLNYGCYLNLNALGLVLEISLNTSNIEQGVLVLQNFLEHKFPIVSVDIQKDAKNYTLQVDSVVKNDLQKKHLLDMVLCIMYRELKLMLPNNFTSKIKLPYTSKKPYVDLLKTEISYNQRHQIVLDSKVLTSEINKNKIKEIEFLLPKFIALLNTKPESEKTFSSQIRNVTLNMCAPEIPNFNQVSKQFPLSNRTIQRKLTQEGMSFRHITNTIKKELSHYLVNEKHLRTKDIAYILGYSEPSAYLHAVKAWRST